MERYEEIAEKILAEIHDVHPPEEIDVGELAADINDVIDERPVPEADFMYVPFDWQSKPH